MKRIAVLMITILMGSAAYGKTNSAKKVLVALEGGGTVQLNAETGTIFQKYDTGKDAFGAIYSKDGLRAFATDKLEGTLVEIKTDDNKVLHKLSVGKGPQQPAITSNGMMYIPLSGDAAIAIIDTKGTPMVVRKINLGNGAKPHIVSLSPDEKFLWVTVQGIDPKVIAIDVGKEIVAMEYRYDMVPRVIAATNSGAYFTGHHSTGLHFASLKDGKLETIYMDRNGDFSEPRKQIEGVSVNEGSSLVGITHEGRKALIIVDLTASSKSNPACTVSKLSDKPYWVTMDYSNEVAFVSIPGASLVESYDIKNCSKKPLWSTDVGGKAKRMAIADR